MQNVKVQSATPSAPAEAGSVTLRKSPSLRLEKQTIRTLSGAELKLVGGGRDGGCGKSNDPTIARY